MKKGWKKNKFKFTCPDCGQTAWGKEGSEIVCGKCMIKMEIGVSLFPLLNGLESLPEFITKFVKGK
jgi:ribosomal protein L37AE/L43A